MNALDTTREQIERLGIVAAIRCRAPVDVLLELGDALNAVPLTAVLIGADAAHSWPAITEFRWRYGSSMVVGAGLLHTSSQASLAIDAGAQFIVSGTYQDAIGEHCRRCGVLYIPGTQDAAGVAAAVEAGWSLIGFFPAGRLGAGRLAQITADVTGARMIVIGGVHGGNLSDYVRCGARAAVVRGVAGSAVRWRMGEAITHIRRLRRQWEEECSLR